MSKKLMDRVSQEMLREAREVILHFPDGKKIRDPLDGRKMLTKGELLKRFDGDGDFAVHFAAKVVFGLKLDRFMRKGKK